MNNVNRYHIYIPSKNRASNCLTANLVKEAGLKFTVVIEPQDYKKYRKFFSKKELYVLPKDNKGLWYARNKCKELSIEKREKAHWQMDDDIRKFAIRKDNKNKKVEPYKAILPLEDIFDSYKGLAVIAHRYTSFAFAQKDKLSFNQNPCSSILVKNSVEAKWRKGTVDDADFALQILQQGKSTIITNRYLIDTVPHLKQSGGLTDLANQGQGRIVRFKQLIEDYPDWFKLGVKKDGTPKLVHCRVWSKFKHRPTKRT